MVTNLIVIAILVILFILLRKSAWKVVNKIVKKDEVDRWTHIFFSFTLNIGDQVHNRRVLVPPKSADLIQQAFGYRPFGYQKHPVTGLLLVR